MLNSLVQRYLKLFQCPVNLRLTEHKAQRYGSLVKGRVLDVGAGEQPYRKYFTAAESYTATNTRRFYTSEGQDGIERFTDIWIDDATRLPFDDASFDALLSFQVLSVIRDPAAFFRESSRVLAPGGILLLTTDFLYPKWSSEDIMRHTDRHLSLMAEEAGFSVEAVESFGGFATMAHSVLNRYVRDYPQQLRKAGGAPALAARGALLLLFLLLAPLLGLLGLLIYRLERNTVDAFDFTVNNLMVCRKKG